MEEAKMLEYLEKYKPEIILDNANFPFVRELAVGDKVSIEIDGVVVRELLSDDEKVVKTADILKAKRVIENRRIL